MKTVRILLITVLAVFLVLAGIIELFLLYMPDAVSGYYRVEAKRLTDELRETGTCDFSKYPHLTGIYTEGDGPLYETSAHYFIIENDGKLYRVEYNPFTRNDLILKVSCVLGLMLLLLIGLLLYLRQHIVKPFGRLNEVPKELAKGNLAVPIPEEKSRFFGQFTWGVNQLRETIEDSRKKEISMQRDKKLLLLSLSHDIKTPLSAIKLNAKALAKGLYRDEEKRRNAAESINTRADEIEHFVRQITEAASQDFMQFDVTVGEVFLSQIAEKIRARYAPQLSMSGTAFEIGEYQDSLLSCDPDRLAECLQNLVENAIKYGDGRKIELRFDKMDGCELITVSNTGCTLEEKELTQIFASFHRGSNAEKQSGNGLGLFICKQLMSRMGGEVFAEIANGCFEITLVVRLA
ncbi:MAG: HAMP domain-containing histidine kinase [Oscillospiraceae bacterium]|nr:HAMP domain-containing histidine kinase [Oscillospiraceae bacterium]